MTREKLGSRDLAYALVLGMLWLFVQGQLTGASSPATTLSFVDDDRPALEFTLGDGPLPIARSLSVYASGTAELRISPPDEHFEVEFSHEELEAILREVREGMLLHYDDASLAAERQRLSNGRIVGTSADLDAPGITVRFRIVEESVNGRPIGTVDKTIQFKNAEYLARRFPTIREYRALAFLERVFFERVAAARSQR